MYYEMKKFYKNSDVVVMFVLALILSIVMPIFFTYDYESYDYSTGKQEVVKGLEGIKLREEQVKKTIGILDEKKLNEALTFYKSSLADGEEKAYYKVEEKYPGLFQFLRDAYSPYGEENSFSVGSIDDADDFYSRNIKKIKSKIDVYGKNYYSTTETQEALKKADAIEKPYNYEFVDQWSILVKSLIFVYAVIVFSGIIISSKLFSFEKEQNMDIIQNSIGKKKLIYIGHKKILAMITYVTIEFLVCSIIVSLIVFGVAGISGWNSQIQTMQGFFTSIYNWSFGQMYIYALFIGWICIISIALTGAFINSIFQKNYVTLILSTFLMIPPLFLSNSSFLPIGLKKLISIQPINGINLLSYIISLSSYKVGTLRVLTPTIIVAIAGIYSFVAIILSPMIFAKRINK